jgi:hypothetical protein
VRGDAAGLELWAIDWEMAGFGIPAADLTRIDLHSWWSAVRPHWPHVGFETVERLARAGQVFQWVAAVDWKSASLECAQPRDRSDAADGVEICRQRLVEAARAAGVVG